MVGDPQQSRAYVEAFRQGLRDLGYVEGKNILVEYRYPEEEADRVPGFVAELVQLKVDVLVSSSTRSDPRRQAGDQDDPDCHGGLLLIRLRSGWSKVWRARVGISLGSPDSPES